MTVDEVFAKFMLNRTGLDANGALLGEVADASWAEGPIAEWTALVDKQLRRCRRGSRPYIELLKRRLITFDEYQTLFKPPCNEENYRYYRPLEWFLVATERQRQYLLASKSPDAFTDFLKIISARSPMAQAFFSGRCSLRLPVEHLKRHAYVCGRSGSGKSELLKLIFYDLQRSTQKNHSVALILIDPHGDLAREIKHLHLNADYERLLYVDPLLFPGKTPTLNPLEINDFSETSIDLHSQELARALAEMFPDASLSLQMMTLLKPCISVLLRLKNKTLLDLQRFMLDDEDLIAAGRRSPHVAERQFFQSMFQKQTYSITKSSLFTKLQSLLNTRAFYHLTVGPSTFDLEKVVERGQVVLFSLAKGQMGAEASTAFGRLLLAQLTAFAFRRAEKNNRKSVFLFVDEFQSIASSSLTTILCESRKYGLHLIMANQLLGNDLTSSMKEAILTNTAVKIVGQTGGAMVRTMAEETGLPQKQLRALPPYHFALKSPSHEALVFKVPPLLVGDRHHFTLNAKERQALHTLISHSGVYRELHSPAPLGKPKADDPAPKPKFS